MEHLECPSEEDWTRRREWFEALFDTERRPGNCFLLSEQALGILVDLQAVYCSGAFVACLLLACTIIDTHIRDAELGNDFEGGIKSTFETSSYANDLDWLRIRRNRLVHLKDGGNPAITVDMHYSARAIPDMIVTTAFLLRLTFGLGVRLLRNNEKTAIMDFFLRRI
jgi:hypothetical protein